MDRGDISAANIYLPVPFFRNEEAQEQLNQNLLRWQQQAETFYRDQHPGRPVLFRDLE